MCDLEIRILVKNIDKKKKVEDEDMDIKIHKVLQEKDLK